MITERRGVPLRAGQLVALLAMGMLGVVDLATGLQQGAVGNPVGPARVLLALTTAAVWSPRYRHGSRLPAALGAALAGWSLLLTIAVVVVGAGAGGSWGLAEAAGLTLTLLVVARRAAPRYAVPASALLVLAVAVQPLRSGTAGELLAIGLLQALLAAGAAAVGTYLRYLEDTRYRQLAAARTEQRAEFARDLHDFIAHRVAGIVVQAQGARFVAGEDSARVRTALEQIEQAGTEAMTAMRRMVAMLRDHRQDAPLVPLAGLADLGPLVERFSAAGGPPVRLAVSGSLDGLPIEVTTSAYRVVMEALTNVRQHAAGATVVDVQLCRTPDWLLVWVADDGAVPPRSAGRTGFGLVGLAERVRAVGGWLQAGPAAGRGWLVDARLPLRPEARR